MKKIVVRSFQMIQKVKDLSPHQKSAIESILGHPIADGATISVRTLEPYEAPEWLRQSWETAKEFGIDSLTPEEIDAEIHAARQDRHRQSRQQ